MKSKQPQVEGPALNLVVSADRGGAKISPTMWGIFFEDINFGADGGLYAELVKNRSFEFPGNMTGWLRILRSGSAGYMYIEKHPENQVNAHYLRMKVQEIADKLCLSPKTVNSYRYRIFEKLKVKNDVELTLLAISHGLVESEETKVS